MSYVRHSEGATATEESPKLSTDFVAIQGDSSFRSFLASFRMTYICIELHSTIRRIKNANH